MDWPAVIADLIAKGATQTSLAAAAGCSQATISDLATGKQKDTKASVGMRLIGLHKAASDVFGEAPREAA